MTRPRAATALAFLFVALLLGTSLYSNVTKPRVMILHSYSTDYAWTRDIDVGIHRVADAWSGYAVTWHYMGTKKHSDPNWLRRAGIVARRAIDRAGPQVLIAIDDAAQELAAKYYVNEPNIDIVFAGVNGSVEPYGYIGATNVTGIFERKQMESVKELVLAMEAAKPEPKARPRLLYILDPSPSLESDRPFIDGYPWGQVDYAGSQRAETYAHWQQLVKESAGKADYLAVANYRMLPRSETDPKFVPAAEAMVWTETNSPLPVIGVNVFNVEDGAMISVGVSPYEQGEVAARLAERILEEGIRAGDIPMEMNKMYVIAMRESALLRRGLRLPTVYEAFSRATASYVE